MLLKNATYLNKHMKFVKGDILVNGNEIEICDTKVTYASEAVEIMDCSSYIVIPGIINGHTHNPSTLGRGLFKDIALKDWCGDSEQGKLQNKLFEYIDGNVNTEDFRILCIKAYTEYIRKGITFIVDSGQADASAEVLSNAINDVGLRAIVDAYEEIDILVDKTNGNVVYCSHLPEEEDITDEQLEICRQIKSIYNVYRMTHCLETKWRRKIVMDNYNMSTVELLAEKQLLDEKTILFHCVHLTDRDMDIISEKKSSIVHCPVSNLWSGTGIAYASKWLDKNINVCLGTDTVLTDIWEVMRTAYYLNKVNTDITHINAENIFKMATINGAKAFGMEKEIGLIDDEYKADLVFIDKDDTRLMPWIENESFSTGLHNLLLECREEMIKHVMINGRWIMKDRKILTVDEESVNREYCRIVSKLYEIK